MIESPGWTMFPIVNKSQADLQYSYIQPSYTLWLNLDGFNIEILIDFFKFVISEYIFKLDGTNAKKALISGVL